MIHWRDAVSEIKTEPCSGMSAETWKAFCRAIMAMPGYIPKVDQPRVFQDFKCDRCEMPWTTGMALEGLPHKAIQNTCGGTWRETSGGSQPAPVVEAGSPVPPLMVNGEEYEIDETV